MTKNVGLYGGTFDPFHIGHLNMAVEILEKKNLDEIWFCPARLSPHKADEQPVAVEHRLKMIERAIASMPKLHVIDLESRREGPSYTIETIKILIQHYPVYKFHLIMGTDSIPGFFHWREPREIIALVPLVIGSRSCEQIQLPANADPEISAAILRGCMHTRVMEISATEIRDRLRRGLYCGHLIPKEVLDYIKEFHLYSSI